MHHIWDPGLPMKIEENSSFTKKTWSIIPFKINGKEHQQCTPTAKNINHIWHVQPNDDNPSAKDKERYTQWSDTGYAGRPFVIGENSRKVSYYNSNRKIITISYDVFLKMGRREDL